MITACVRPHSAGRVALLAVLALLVGVLSACGSSTPPAATQASVLPGQFGGAFTATSTAASIAVLARNGIATVANESASTPQSAVTGTTRMTFTTAQVRAMALQLADHGGIAGAALDSATTTGQGYVPLSYLLAAWVKTGTSPGAASVRAVMGSQDWTHAPTIMFPTIALPLFVSDVIAALPASAPKGSTTSTPGAASTADNPGVPKVMDAAFIPTGLLDTPCSTVSGFVQGVLSSVFTALTLTAPTGTGVAATIGGFFVNLWNTALSLAQQAIQGLIKAVTGPVVHAIESVAGAVAVISEVASYLSPWSVKVTADPASIAGGDSGSFLGRVDGGSGGADYPAAVLDCASNLNLTLPTLSAGGAEATWTVSSPLQASGDTAVVLDKNAASTLAFSSTEATSSGECGTNSDSTGSGQLSVSRPAIKDLQTLADSMVTTGLGAAGSIAGPIVTSILQPIFGAILSKLDALTQADGTGHVTVTSPGATCTPSASSSPSASPQAAACLVGVWRQTTQTNSGRSEGGAGIVYTFGSDGTGSVDYNGSAPVVTPGFTVQYAGSATLRISALDPAAGSGSLTETYLSSTVTGTNGGFTSKVPTGSGTLSWTCQANTATLSTPLGDGTTQTFDLARTTH